jgi:serine/threonine protein kinase
MNTAIECPTNQQLRALSLGVLSNDDSDALFQHIAHCDQCRSELETVEDVEDSLIASLREPLEQANFSVEPDCRLALVKALGALAIAENEPLTADLDRLPKTIGEYEIVRPIGSGGMGNVFLARHTKLGREVALKVLASHRLADSRTVDRFEAEMRAVGRLSHPNVVTAHDAREVDGTAVLVTEFVSGLDLGQLLQRTGALKVAEACEIVRQVAVALAYTNSQGFVHRDIKPSNVMLSDNGEIKLLDLGLARLQYGENERTELTGTGQAMGTADYVAPEQVADSKTVDIRADIYALGCTLFKLLTGRAPFADDQHLTTFSKMTAHVSETPPSLGKMLTSAPPSLVQLVDSMLAKKPADRPSTPDEIANALLPHCKNHDLKKLIREAQLSEPRKNSIVTLGTIVKPATQAWMKRTVPTSVAVAAGFFGVLLGMCLSIIVVITNPDGTKTFLQLAEGSKVEISEGDSKAVNGNPATALPGDPNKLQADRDSKPVDDTSPLSFGILANRDSTGHLPSVTEPQILEATRLLRASDGSKPVRTPYGTWYATADDELGAPIKELNAGKSFVLVSDQHTIRWPSVNGHVISMQTRDGIAMRTGRREASIELRLDKELGSAFAKLTKQNIRNQLAIIVNGLVRSAPIINSEIGEGVSITGIFNPGEAQQLGQWLHGGLVYPLPGKMPQDNAGGTSAVKSGSNLPSTLVEPGSTTNETKLVELQNNLRLIGLAFMNFNDAYGKFPGTSNTHAVRGEEKIYPFSWRVAILPWIEHDDIFQQYHFDERWDSEHNLTLLDKMPTIYRSPFADANQEAGETNILGFASKNSALGTNGGEKLETFTDGSSNTLLLVEAACTLPWTKPQDIPGDANQATFFNNHAFTYLMADGRVNSGKQPPEELLNKMISRNGGEVFELIGR